VSGVTTDVNGWLFLQASDSDGLRKQTSRSSFGPVLFPADRLVRAHLQGAKCDLATPTGTLSPKNCRDAHDYTPAEIPAR
jgi:hypothetical protein